MKQYIEQIFKLGYRKFSGKSNKEFGVQTKENIKLLCDEIRTFLLSSNLKVDKPGVGTGGWIAVPYVRVFDENEAPSATNGVYIVYLFADTEDSVFLTLNQGIENASKGTIVANRGEIQKRIDGRDFIQNNKKINELRDYGESTIFYKEYKRDALPSEDNLQKDLKMMVDVYKNYLDSKKIGDGSGAEKVIPKTEADSSTKQVVSDKFMSLQKNDGSFSQIQCILFGAPGTGKSFAIDDPKGKYKLKTFDRERVFRTTFHPDYDYAQFVGAYKPKKDDKDEKITYAFVPQVFAKAYVTAWKLYFSAGNASTAENQVYLVIEEINRGNCAQIFGDIFQLLDRVSEGPDKGFSRYSIDADFDFAEWLGKNGIGGGKLKLPPNLNILATMNTSDQSLFPMDSAFKRRFDWEYVPIRYEAEKDKDGKKKDENWKADEFWVDVDEKYTFNWLHFLKKVNADIYKVTESEDKQMGEFFIKSKRVDQKITYQEFRSKVLFYLWDSVYKDEVDRKVLFHFDYNGTDVTFQRLFSDDFPAILKKMLQNLDEAYNSDEFKNFKILNSEKESENQ